MNHGTKEEELHQLLRRTIKDIYGIRGISLSSYDGLSIVTECSEDEDEEEEGRRKTLNWFKRVRAKLAHKYSAGAQQITNIGLGQLRTSTVFYDDCIVVQESCRIGREGTEEEEGEKGGSDWHPTRPVLTVVLSPDGNLGRLRETLPTLMRTLEPLTKAIDALERASDVAENDEF